MAAQMTVTETKKDINKSIRLVLPSAGDTLTTKKQLQKRAEVVNGKLFNKNYLSKIGSSLPHQHNYQQYNLRSSSKREQHSPVFRSGLPPTQSRDFNDGSNFDRSPNHQRKKAGTDSATGKGIKRKGNYHQNGVNKKRKKRNGSSIKPLNQCELGMTEPDSTSPVPSPAGTIVPRRRQKLGRNGNRSNHPLVIKSLRASLETLHSDSSLDESLITEPLNFTTNEKRHRDSHQCITLTAPHFSEPENKAMLPKEPKDMRLGWKTNPSASSSLSQDTTREMRNSKPATATRSPQEKLQSRFDFRAQDTFKPSVQSSSLEEIKESAGPVNYSVPIRSVRNELPDASDSESGLRRRDRSNSSPSLSWPLIPQDPPADVSNLPRAASLPNMKLQSSFEEFTPDFTGGEDDEDDETYWLRCSSPGLYQCRVSGLVFDMKGEGDVSYRIVPWCSRLLSRRGKKPAGPLFDIRCQQQSVTQLHLPHCEIHSTGGCTYLSVAHVGDRGIEFIKPEKITETHVIINITGFSAFGIVRDEDSPNDQVQALVLLFYKPAPHVKYPGLLKSLDWLLRKFTADPESDHQINVLLLPKNVVLRHVLRFRMRLDGDERFLETPPRCRLQPNQRYTLSTRPGEDSVLVQPKEAEFDAESYNNYFPTFQVVYGNFMRRIELSLKEGCTKSIWNREVCLSTAGVGRSYGPTQQNIGPSENLNDIRAKFIDRISGPVLKSLLDKLLEIKVLSDAEREAVEGERTRRDKAEVLIDMVRNKGDDASSEMIRFLTELDQYLSEHLGLI